MIKRILFSMMSLWAVQNLNGNVGNTSIEKRRVIGPFVEAGAISRGSDPYFEPDFTPSCRPIGENRETYTICAVRLGKIDELKALYELEPQLLFQVDQYGEMAATYAVREGKIDVLKALYELDPKLLLKTDKNGYTPATYAVREGKVDVLKALYELNPELLFDGNDTHDTSVTYAVSTGRIDVLKVLYELDPKRFFQAGVFGFSPVKYAVSIGRIDVLKALYELDPQLLFKADRYGETPATLAVRLAARFGKIDVLKALYKLDPQLLLSTNKNGETLATLAVREGNIYKLKALFKIDFQLFVKADKNGEIPIIASLVKAVKYGKTDELQTLFKLGIKILDDIVADNPIKARMTFATILVILCIKAINQTVDKEGILEKKKILAASKFIIPKNLIAQLLNSDLSKEGLDAIIKEIDKNYADDITAFTAHLEHTFKNEDWFKSRISLEVPVLPIRMGNNQMICLIDLLEMLFKDGKINYFFKNESGSYGPHKDTLKKLITQYESYAKIKKDRTPYATIIQKTYRGFKSRKTTYVEQLYKKAN